MRRTMLAVAACALVTAPAPAQERQPAQPRPATAAPRLAQLEEEVETLDAQRDVKKAMVKAAELGVRVAGINFERVNRLAASAVISKEEVEHAKLEVEVARVQVEIRAAELKEVEVKVKYSKKRLEDARAAVGRTPPAPQVGEKAADGLRAELAKVLTESSARAVEMIKIRDEVDVAEKILLTLKEAVAAGRVRTDMVAAAEERFVEAKENLAKATRAQKALEDAAAALQKKIRDIEK